MLKDAVRRVADFLVVTGILCLAAYGVFRLPYAFPPQSVTRSLSFDAGFSNRVSALAAMAAIALLCLRALVGRRTPGEAVDAIFADPPRTGLARFPAMPKSILLFFAGFYIVVPVLLYNCLSQLEGWGEPASCLPRFELAWRYHLHLYSQIDWAYGPALFYIPTAFIAVGRGLGADPNLAYLISYICISLAGLWALFYIVNSFRVRVSDRVWIFSLVALCCCSESLGVNYTLLRFAAPYAAILMMHRAARRAAPFQNRRAVLKLCGFCFVSALVILSISIELGLAYVIAQFAYAIYRRVLGERWWLWTVLATALAPLALAAVFPDSLQILDGFSKGGNSFPVFPGLHVIVYLLSLFWLVPLLIGSCATRRPGANAPLLAGWSLLLIATISAALGRCDFGHVLFNGVGAFLLTLALLARRHPRLFPMYAILFVTLFGVIARIVGLSFAAAHGQTAQLVAALSGSPAAVDATPNPLVADLKLEEYSAVAVPLGIDSATQKWLAENGRFAPQCHPDYVNVVSMSDLDKKIRDLSKADAVLVPKWVAGLGRLSDAALRNIQEKGRADRDKASAQALGVLLLCPVSFKSTQLPFQPDLEEARYIAACFRPVRSARGWVLMTPRKR